MDGLESLRSPGNVLMVFFTSIVIWLLETVKYWFVLHAFGLEQQVRFFILMLMNGVVNLATTIPRPLVTWGLLMPPELLFWLQPEWMVSSQQAIPLSSILLFGCRLHYWEPFTWRGKVSNGAIRSGRRIDPVCLPGWAKLCLFQTTSSISWDLIGDIHI